MRPPGTIGFTDIITAGSSPLLCLCVPSLFEGFGPPVLEAMSLGAAVIASNVTSLPEISGDAALSVAPEDVDALAEAMARLEDDSALHADLQRRVLARSKLFS